MDNPAQAKKPEAADALADMAPKEKEQVEIAPSTELVDGDPLAALSKMSEGEDIDVEKKSLAVEHSATASDGEATVTVDVHVAVSAGPSPAAQERAQARAVQNRQQAHAQALAYKKTVFPLMLVVGGILALVAIIGLYYCISINWQSRFWHEYGTWLLLLTILAFPLSGIMLFGAWWFHRDVQKAKPSG